MGKKVSVWISVFIALLLCVATYLVTATAINSAYREEIASLRANQTSGQDVSSNEDMYSKLRDIEDLVNQVFVGDINRDELTDAVCSAYLAALGDKYTMYHTSEEMKEYLSDSEGSYVGIGVQASFDTATGGIYVITVFPDSPAAEAGILVGDIIVQANDVVCTSETYYKTINTIRGEEGTEVDLVIKRGDKTFDLTVARAKVDAVSVAYSMPEKGVALIRINQFSQTTPDDFRAALESASEDKAEYYVFDMRNNGGGNLGAIVEVLDMLLPEGTILTYSDKDGNIIGSYSSTDKESLDAPMAVLINGNTASAAELFTAALRDYEKAVTVGTTTYGKGEMQSLYTLDDGSGVRISTYYYNPPCGVNYEGIGITPDIEFEMPEELAERFYQLTPEEDVQLQAAITAVKQQ